MAKKLNKKVAIIGIVLLVLIIGGGAGLLVVRQIKRNPERALAKAKQAIDAGNYEEAEIQLGLSYAYGKTDAYKVERLFELAEFHQINNDLHEAEWKKALGCWNKIVSIDQKNLQAREHLLDYYYQAAEAGTAVLWKTINENTTEILDILKSQNTEPEASLLSTHAKALLSIAQRGEVPNRQELLDECIAVLDPLIEQSPGDDSLYLLRAEATLLQGEMDESAGIRNAGQKAQEEAFNWLEIGAEKADNKAKAIATLLTFQMQTSPADPNHTDQIRADIETQAQTIEPNEDFYVLISRAYSERQGNMDPQAETNRAIEAIRQARKLDPENIEYIIRATTLLYRKGSAFNDSDAITDAIEMAEEALTLPGTQDNPGPLQNRNLFYRYKINEFLSNVYLEKAYAANRDNDETAAAKWGEKARPRVKEISDYIRTPDSPVVQKFQGMLALAEGETDKAIRLMYKAYEQSKALDKEGRRSNIDPVLCVTLASVMQQRNEPGMQSEFLGKAISNSNGIVLQKPQLWLDYADLIAQRRAQNAWGAVLSIVTSYQSRYGASQRSNSLKTQALIATNQFEEAQAMIAAMDATKPETLQLEIALLTGRIAQAQLAIQQLKDDQQPSDEQIQELADLRADRYQRSLQLLDLDANQLDPQTLTAVCYDYIRDDQIQQAATLLEKYLRVIPDNISLKVLALQLQEDNPKDITAERRRELQIQAFETLNDSKERNLSLAQFYRVQGEFETALQHLDQIPTSSADDLEVLLERYEIAIQQNDIDTAANLLPKLRALNADSCDGNMFAAQIDSMKEEYASALRKLDECLNIQPLSSRLYYLKGQVLSQQTEYESAIENFQQALSMSPANPVYARNLVSALYSRNNKLGSKVTPQQQGEALQAIQVAMFLDPTNWQLQSVYAETIADREPDRALMIRQQLLKSQPNAANALMLGNMAMRIARSEWDDAKKTGLIELAGQAYLQAIEIDPTNENAQQALADHQRMMGQEDPTKIFEGNKDLIWKYYLRNSQFDQAMEVLTGLFETNPEDTVVLRGLILCAEGMGNRDQAKEYLDTLSELDKSKDAELWVLQKYLDNAFIAEAQTKLAGFKERYPDEKLTLIIDAWIQMGEGQLQEALSLANRYLTTDTENAGAWRLRGRLYRLMNQPQKAIEDLQRSKSIQPDPMVRLELATVYNETANLEAAIGELKQGLEDPQSPMQLRLTLEAIYQKNNKTRELEALYRSTLEKYPQSFFWLYRAGNYYSQNDQLSKAQQLLKMAWDLSIQQNNLDLGIFVAYLDSLYQDRQYDPALSFATEWIDSPLASVAYAFMGQIQLNQSQDAKAAESFNKALEKAGANDRLQGIVMEKMLDALGEEALNAWQQEQLAQDSKSLPARLLAYRLALKNARYNEAVEQIEQCIEIVGPDHPGWLSLAMKKGNAMIMAYTKTADQSYLDRSITLFESILAKQPNNPTLLNNLAYLLADNDKQLETALEYARKAHQGNPGNTIFLDTYAYVQCKLKHYEDAQRNLLRAIQILDISRTPVPWDMYKHLGMARQGLGNNRQAVESYQKALDASDEIPDTERQQLQQTIDELKLLL